MLDIEKCTYEDSWYNGDQQVLTYYFAYCDLYSNGLFGNPFNVPGNVVGMSIMLEVYPNDGELRSRLSISPTVFEFDQLSDVDWEYLRYDVDYNNDFLMKLFKKGADGTADYLKRKILGWKNEIKEINDELAERK